MMMFIICSLEIHMEIRRMTYIVRDILFFLSYRLIQWLWDCYRARTYGEKTTQDPKSLGSVLLKTEINMNHRRKYVNYRNYRILLFVLVRKIGFFPPSYIMINATITEQ